MASNGPRHKSAIEMMSQYGHRPMHTLWACVTEACHLLDMPARTALLEWLGEAEITVHDCQQADLARMAGCMKKYKAASRKAGPDLADVGLVMLADRLGVYEIFTVDKADFATYRTLRNCAFVRLWPED